MTIHMSQLQALQNAPLQQHPAFAATMQHLGRPALSVALPSCGREVTVLRRRCGPLRLGLVSRANLARRDLPVLRAATGCRVLVVNAETPGAHPGLLIRTGAHHAELGLTGSAASLRAGMAQKWRNRLHRAERAGLKVTHTALPPEPGHWLLRIEQAQQKVKGYRGYPPVFTAAFAAANRGQARLFEASERGEPVAAMLFLCHGSVATYHLGWSGDDGRRKSAHHLLLWQAMLALARRGITRIDLGLVDTESAPGLARFKLGCGATCRELGGTRIIWM